MKLFIILMAFSSSVFAAGDLYRCDVNGKVLYTDSPCEDFGGSQVKRFSGPSKPAVSPQPRMDEVFKEEMSKTPGRLLEARHDLPWFFGVEDDCKRLARRYKASDDPKEKKRWLDRYVEKGCKG